MTDKTKHAATLAALLTTEWGVFRARHSTKAYRAKFGHDGPLHPDVTAADALALIRIGNGVARWAVRACNGEGHRVTHPASGGWCWQWDDSDNIAHEKADARALAKLQAIADRYGATVKLGGDPRGYVVKLRLASGRHNTWGGAPDGWGVA